MLNLVAEPGETAGFSAERHIHVLAQHAPGFTVHDIIVDAAGVPGEREREQLRRTADILDAQVEFADVSRPGTPLHDPARLAAALERVGYAGMAPEPPTVSSRPCRRRQSNGPRGDDFVAMTAEVKDELSRLVVNSVSARRAEVASLLRFAGGLHIVAGRVVVEAEVDLGIIARRLRKDIHDLYGYNAVVHVLSASGIRKSTRYVVRVAKDGEALARQTGLLDLRGRPVRGSAGPGGRRQRRRCRSRLARSVFGARLADRAGPLVGAGGQLPRPGGGAGARRCGAAARASARRRARCAAATGSWCATARPSARC